MRNHQIQHLHPAECHIPPSAVSGSAVRLISAYATRNLGDAAILRAIASLSPDRHAETGRLEQAPVGIPGLRYCDSRAGSKVRVSVGGDIFNNHRPYFVTRHFMSKLNELRADPARTIVMGQTIPESCRNLALLLLTDVLARTRYVMVRDAASADLLRGRGVDAKLSWDVAFLTEPDLAARSRAKTLLDESGIEASRAVLVSVRPFDSMYPLDQSQFEANLSRLCGALADRGHQVSLIIQSDVAAWDEDRSTVMRLRSRDTRLKVVDCLADQSDPDPVGTLTALLQIANIAVGVRYHTTVLRLAAGRQPFNLYYSRKGADLQKRLGLRGAYAGAIDASEIVRAIEATADRPFDPTPLKADIRQHFDRALGLALA